MAYKLDAADQWLRRNTPKGYAKAKKREAKLQARETLRLGRDEAMRRAKQRQETQIVPGVKRTKQSQPLQSQARRVIAANSGPHPGPVHKDAA